MNAVVESVRSLWVPLDGGNLLVPNVAIAEVINYQPLDMIGDGPEWLLGRLRWRDRDLPVIAMEAVCGMPLPQAERGARISVLNSVKADSELPFYAMVTAGIPRLISADADALGGTAGIRAVSEGIADPVQVFVGQAVTVVVDVVAGLRVRGDLTDAASPGSGGAGLGAADADADPFGGGVAGVAGLNQVLVGLSVAVVVEVVALLGRGPLVGVADLGHAVHAVVDKIGD